MAYYGQRKFNRNSNDKRETPFLFQHLSVLVDRFNMGAFRGSFANDSEPWSERFRVNA